MAEDLKDRQTAQKRRNLNLIIFTLVALVIISIWGGLFRTGEQAAEISYSEFYRQLQNKNVKEVRFEGMKLSGVLRSKVNFKDGLTDKFVSMLPPYDNPQLAKDLKDSGVEQTSVPPAEEGFFGALFMNILFIAVLIALWWFMMRRFSGQTQNQLSSFTRGHHKLYRKEVSNITFADVAGMAGAKEDLYEIIEFLKEPKKFKSLGAKIPKGVLMVGPPGTGKTLLSRAVAGEAEVPFFSLSGSEFIEMLVGVGAARVRSLFKDAKQSEPSIIFIDEIDSIGRVRGTGLGGGHDEREQTLNQLLSEMDGFEPHDEVIVIAATNRPDVLDAALLRPGRFDRKVVIDNPQLDERLAILKIHARNKPLGEDVDLEDTARSTAGLAGADLENILNEAALIAARKGKESINSEDIVEATDKVLIGTERKNLLHEEEKEPVAYHEAGHTVLAWILPTADPVQKVSITPRGLALGHTFQLPERDKHIHFKQEMLDRLRVLLGGRASERNFLHDISSGAAGDFKMASELARRMVCLWGMSDEVGSQYIDTAEEHPFLGRTMAISRGVSEKTAEKIDAEIRKLLDDAEEDAKKILNKHAEAVHAVVDALISKETLNSKDLEKLMKKHGVKKMTMVNDS